MEGIRDFFGGSSSNTFLGFVGWGPGCVTTDLAPRQGNSAVEGFLYRDNSGRVRFQRIGSCLAFFSQRDCKEEVYDGPGFGDIATHNGEDLNFVAGTRTFHEGDDVKTQKLANCYQEHISTIERIRNSLSTGVAHSQAGTHVHGPMCGTGCGHEVEGSGGAINALLQASLDKKEIKKLENAARKLSAFDKWNHKPGHIMFEWLRNAAISSRANKADPTQKGYYDLHGKVHGFKHPFGDSATSVITFPTKPDSLNLNASLNEMKRALEDYLIIVKKLRVVQSSILVVDNPDNKAALPTLSMSENLPSQAI